MAVDWVCGDCDYFEATLEECHRYPPRKVLTTTPPTYDTIWPTVTAITPGCGECLPPKVSIVP